MSSLGDVLEVIFARPDPAVSVHAVVHERQDHEVAQRVMEQAGNDLRDVPFPTLIHCMMAPVLAAETLGRITKKVRRDPPEPGPVPESELTIWLDASGRARLEHEFGSLLAFRGRAEGAVYEEVAVTEISYGDPIDERLLAAS